MQIYFMGHSVFYLGPPIDAGAFSCFVYVCLSICMSALFCAVIIRNSFQPTDC